jgi:hypothetical protein
VSKQVAQPSIVAGYSGTIPVRFRELSQRETTKAKTLDRKAILKRVGTVEIVQPDDVKNFVRLLVAKEDFDLLGQAPGILEKFPQFTPYVIDLIIKKTEHISPKVRAGLTRAFANTLTHSKYLPEYILVAIIRLLSADGFTDKQTLMTVFRGLKRNAGAYVGRILLEALDKVVLRGEVIEIRQYYDRADNWEKRAIIQMVNRHLSEDEKRPWLKNVKIHASDDPFAIEIFDPKGKKKRK